jgi:GNAT superfamily N-acetyltransferase
VAASLSLVLLALWLARRARQWHRDRLLLAELLVGGEVGQRATERPCERRLPGALLHELARVFAKVFADNAMYRCLYRGNGRRWRRHRLEELFAVHASIASEFGRARFMVDPSRRSTRGGARLPVATCFASVSVSGAPEPGVLDVVRAGGLVAFWKLGLTAFLRSYRVEQWMVALRRHVAESVARGRRFMCIEHMFVRETEQCVGVGSSMLDKLAAEAAALGGLPLLVMVTDPEGVDFFTHHGFRVLASERYSTEGAELDRKQLLGGGGDSGGGSSSGSGRNSSNDGSSGGSSADHQAPREVPRERDREQRRESGAGYGSARDEDSEDEDDGFTVWVLWREAMVP